MEPRVQWPKGGRCSRAGMGVLAVLLAAAGYFFWSEHQIHLAGLLPYLLLLACPLMHLWHRHGRRRPPKERSSP
jgi:hypothetical protein